MNFSLSQCTRCGNISSTGIHVCNKTCPTCWNFVEHCWCNLVKAVVDSNRNYYESLMAIGNGTPPKCPSDCICEVCIEEAMNQALLGQAGVMPGETLTSHLSKACECGAKSVGSGGHSSWCPAFLED